MQKWFLLFAMVQGLVLLTVEGAIAQEEPFFLFKDGEAIASIDVPANASEDVDKAVDVFREAVREGYGIDLPLAPADEVPNRIELVIEPRGYLDEDHTEIAFPSEHVMRIAGGESGVMRTLFYLLEEHAGVRFLYQGSMNGEARRRRTHYPPRRELAIPRERVERDSAYPLRRATVRTGRYFGTPGGGPETRRYYWSWEVKLGAKERVATFHNLGYYPHRDRTGRHVRGIVFPIDRYAASDDKPDEEMFPILNSERYLPHEQPEGRQWRAHWQPCFTSQAAEDEAVRNILAFLEKHPDTGSISLSVNDNGGHCQCEACLAMDGEGRTDIGMRNRSESYYRWVNAVTDRVTDQFPEVMFAVTAYREVLEPPTVTLHPSVMVVITMDFQPTIDVEVREQRQDLIRRWNEKASHLGFYSYDVGAWTWSLPRIYTRQHQQMIRFFHEHGGKGAYSEGAHYFTLTGGPRMYVYFKLLEDPDLDLEATLMDWHRAAVGEDAAPYLHEYFMFWEEYWRSQAVKVDQFWGRRDKTYLQRGHFATYMYGLEQGDMAHCRELMEQVVALAEAHGTSGQKERAQLLMTCFEWYEAAAIATAGEWIGPDGKLPDAEAAVSLLRNVPEAIDAHRRWRRILERTDDWVAAEGILKRDGPGVVGFNMAAVFPFVHHTKVRNELEALARDERCPAHIRQLASIMLGYGSDESRPDRLLHQTFEESEHGWEPAHPVHGTTERTADVATVANHALECRIEHTNYTARRPLADLKPQLDYFVTARLYVAPGSEEARTQEGTVEFWGTPLPTGWNQPTYQLERGVWHELHAYIPRSEHVDADRLASEIGGVQEDSDVESLLAGRLMLRLRNFEPGTVAYLDDVQVHEVSNAE